MTITTKNELSRAPNWVRGKLTLAAGATSADIPTAGFDVLVYTTATAPSAGTEIDVQMVDEDGNNHTVPEETGRHSRVSSAEAVGYLIDPLPAVLAFVNNSVNSETVYYEFRKTATHDRGR